MKNLGRRMFILLTLMLVITLLFSACAKQAAPPKELKIGALVGLSGAGSESMARVGVGITEAVNWLNDNGGLTVNGDHYLIKLISEDYKMTVDGIVAATTKLVYEDQVKFIVDGCPIPPFVAAISSITESNQVLRIDTDGRGSSDMLNANTPYAFSSSVDMAYYETGFEAFLELYPEVKTVALTAPDEASSILAMDNLKARCKAHGLNVVDEETFVFGATDFYPMWNKILTYEPDCVMIAAGFPEWMASILKQGRELGFEGPVLSGNIGGDPYITLDIAGDYTTNFIAFGYDFKSPKMTSMIKEIAKILQDTYGVELTYDSLIGWEATWELAQAIEYAQSLDPTVVRDAWETMTSIETPSGPGTMGGLKTFGLNHVCLGPCPMFRIMNGEVEHIEWFEPQLP